VRKKTSKRGLLPGEASGLPGSFGDLGLKKVAFGKLDRCWGFFASFLPLISSSFFLAEFFFIGKTRDGLEKFEDRFQTVPNIILKY
jgi:hypothetical protein